MLRDPSGPLGQGCLRLCRASTAARTETRSGEYLDCDVPDGEVAEPTRALADGQKQALEQAVGEGYRVIWLEGSDTRWKVAKLLFHNAHIRLTTPEAYEVHRQNIEWGVKFSREGPEFSLGREAGHSTRRIVHAEDGNGVINGTVWIGMVLVSRFRRRAAVHGKPATRAAVAERCRRESVKRLAHKVDHFLCQRIEVVLINRLVKDKG